MLKILQQHVLDDADRLAVRFRTASPFPHLVIDSFLRPQVVDTLLAEFPAFERGDCRSEDGSQGLKSSFERVRELGPGFSRIDDLVRSREFLELLGKLTGISGLLYDRDYVGGGTHENRPGQDLDPHVDFNYHPTSWLHRRLNLLLYLNPEWREDWGGCLELHTDPWKPADDRVTTVLPVLNRCVIFETSERSWHGFLPIRPPTDRPALSRRSVALYFYTRERPPAEIAPSHATVYVERALPSLDADRPISQSQALEMTRLIGRRHQHADRLFRREQALVAYLSERLQLLLEPGSVPRAQPLAAVRRLVELQDEALHSLYLREIGFSTLLALVQSLVVLPFRMAPPLSLASAVSGCFDDGWASRQLRVHLRASVDLRGIELHGHLPAQAGPEQELSIHLAGEVRRQQLGVGDFTLPVAIDLRAGSTIDLEITAAHAFSPKARGLSEDGRDLAWLLLEIVALPA